MNQRAPRAGRGSTSLAMPQPLQRVLIGDRTPRRRALVPYPFSLSLKGFVRPAHDARRAGRSSVAAQLMNCSWVSPPDLHQGDVGEAGRLELANPGDVALDVGTARHLAADTSSSRTVLDACSNDAGTGSSALTLHPPVNQRNWSMARFTATLLVGVVRHGDLADARLAGASRLVEHLARARPGARRRS